jgi:hypothetical protein
VILDLYMNWFFPDIELIVLNKLNGTVILDLYLNWLFLDIELIVLKQTERDSDIGSLLELAFPGY